jgi:glycosyltransferase involved in cell wall biosynthesis
MTDRKIKVIYPGVQKEISVNNWREGEEILKKFNVRKPYFFYIGLIIPRKNILNLLKAFKIVNKKYPHYRLILAGYLRPELLDIGDTIKELNLQGKVQYIGPVKEKEKVVLYKNSVALVFPSLHEGFGLPVLEAQSLGVPVLTSNVTALPEVAGEGALYVDPYNVEEIAKGMERIAFDENLRKDLIQKGYENIKRFSWGKAAKELLEVFKEVYENSSGK